MSEPITAERLRDTWADLCDNFSGDNATRHENAIDAIASEVERCARLRAVVAALMERGSDVYPWWCRMDDGWVSCQWCYHCAFGSAEGLAHAPDCPAMAVEAEMRDET
jgi:hypothetical protein